MKKNQLFLERKCIYRIQVQPVMELLLMVALENVIHIQLVLENVAAVFCWNENKQIWFFTSVRHVHQRVVT